MYCAQKYALELHSRCTRKTWRSRFCSLRFLVIYSQAACNSAWLRPSSRAYITGSLGGLASLAHLSISLDNSPHPDARPPANGQPGPLAVRRSSYDVASMFDSPPSVGSQMASIFAVFFRVSALSSRLPSPSPALVAADQHSIVLHAIRNRSCRVC